MTLICIIIIIIKIYWLPTTLLIMIYLLSTTLLSDFHYGIMLKWLSISSIGVRCPTQQTKKTTQPVRCLSGPKTADIILCTLIWCQDNSKIGVTPCRRYTRQLIPLDMPYIYNMILNWCFHLSHVRSNIMIAMSASHHVTRIANWEVEDQTKPTLTSTMGIIGLNWSIYCLLVWLVLRIPHCLCWTWSGPKPSQIFKVWLALIAPSLDFYGKIDMKK